MLRVIIYTLILIVLFYTGHVFLPWWYLAIAAFLAGAWLPYKRGIHAAVSLFFAAAVVWIIPAWIADMKNDSILSSRMAELMMGTGSPFAIILLTALIGGLIALLFGMCGRVFR